MNANQQVTATFNTTQNISALNHIIFLAQENRSFDHYFGALRGYWAQNGYPDQSFDGLPQFNPVSGAAPLLGTAPAVPGCDPTSLPPADCVFDTNNPITSYHLITQCIENPSPSWNEAHVDWNFNDQIGLYPATLNGFVWTAGHDARYDVPPFNDVAGIRAMGYYDGSDLNYYYFMASNFATSDRWFHPAMTRTPPNRAYLIAGTSQGYVYGEATDSADTALLTSPTIFQELQTAGVTWKIYVDPVNSPCSGPPYDPACLLSLSSVQDFQWGQPNWRMVDALGARSEFRRGHPRHDALGHAHRQASERLPRPYAQRRPRNHVLTGEAIGDSIRTLFSGAVLDIVIVYHGVYHAFPAISRNSSIGCGGLQCTEDASSSVQL